MTYRDYRIGFSGTDLISPTQFEYYPELKYRMPQTLAHALYRVEEVQGEINDQELSEEWGVSLESGVTSSTDGSVITGSNSNEVASNQPGECCAVLAPQHPAQVQTRRSVQGWNALDP